MSLPELLAFAAACLLYALVAAAAVLALWAALRGARAALRAAPAVLSTAFFLALTHYPFPAPGQLDCSQGGMPPRLVPLVRLGQEIAALWRAGAPPAAWLGDLDVFPALMNLLLCALIGLALAPLIARARGAALFGLGLTLAVEISQLTGVFGLYDCAYRQFDVDDIILNLLGVVLGHAAGRAWLRRRG
ncbi:VanZ family protein [Pseudoroseicyclus aestuarii]|uniref:VanZ like protein n=1 Tax=Pseudoroseicyclus aestuarii TaxID=1795041 RepID=A0A318STN3_9RHOB|nr:VanZ family protein [Pseudoroseicyclus aestuarii]PYE82220.1 VanZ like protein [Pseudoroseicyclus aestuarii]